MMRLNGVHGKATLSQLRATRPILAGNDFVKNPLKS